MQHSHSTLAFKPLILIPPTLYLFLLHPHHRLMLPGVSLNLLFPLFFPNSLSVFQWNAGDIQARSTKLLHFISSHSVDPICIQESNLNLSSSFWIPGFSALQSDGAHSRSGIFSIDVTDASGGVIIFVRQDLFFSELFASSLSSLDPYSDYVKVNISPNDSSSISFLNVYAPCIYSTSKDSKTNLFSPSILSHLHGSGSGKIFALPLSPSQKKDCFHCFCFQLPASAFTSQILTLRCKKAWKYNFATLTQKRNATHNAIRLHHIWYEKYAISRNLQESIVLVDTILLQLHPHKRFKNVKKEQQSYALGER